MQIKREHLERCLNEVDALLNDYFERTENAQKGQPKLEMNWAEIMRIENNGKLALFTAREGNQLQGFAMYVLIKHLHHASTHWAMCDILAVNPDVRRQGIATAMVEHALSKFKHMGIDYVVHGYRTVYGVTPLFPKLGFTCIEHAYMKAL
jgi:GNAT superfamily N-acetyltransferase